MARRPETGTQRVLMARVLLTHSLHFHAQGRTKYTGEGNRDGKETGTRLSTWTQSSWFFRVAGALVFETPAPRPRTGVSKTRPPATQPTGNQDNKDQLLSQSNSIRIAARCCLTVGADWTAASCSMETATIVCRKPD